MKGNNGISSIVATVLIILITVAAVTIIWVGIIPMISESADFEGANVRLEIVTQGGFTFWDEATSLLHVQVSRGADNVDMTGVRIIVTIEGTSVTYPSNVEVPDDAYVAPEVNNKKVYVIEGITQRPSSVEVVPLISSDGSEREGSSSGSTSDVPDGVSFGGGGSSRTKSRSEIEVIEVVETCLGETERFTPVAADASTYNAITNPDAYRPEGAIDGRTDGYWYSWFSQGGVLGPQWIYFDLGDVKCVSGFRNYYYGSVGLPQVYDVEYSDDAETWENALEGIVDTSYSTWTEHSFDEIQARYIRIYVTSHDSNWAQVAEFEAMVREFG